MTLNHNRESMLRSRRIPYRQRVVVAPKSGGERRVEESLDLSLGGMFITSMLPLDPGQVINVEMPLDSIRFQATGKVAWIRTVEESEDKPTGMAIEFTGLNQHQKKLIHRQISNHTQAGGQLKVGSPPKAGGKPAGKTRARPPSAARRHSGLWRSPRLWASVGVAAAIIAILTLVLKLF